MKLFAVVVFGFAALAVAHPGHEEPQHELLYKRHFNSQMRRGLKACAGEFERRGINTRAHARRQAVVESYRKTLKSKVSIRDTDTVANTSHLSTESYNLDTPETTIFNSSNTCILNPEGETGPYYVPGELIRSNLTESQPGVPIVLEAQFVDVTTCAPIEGLWWDLWNCNSTGVYSGVVANGNGDTSDLSNINKTFLRGIQPSDADGVVTFDTIFPGHYSGRATHHHMVVHMNSSVLANGTLTGGTVAHIGQAFWDQDLIYKVEATYPYNTSNITITENVDDRVFITETEDTDSDPVFEYVYLGDDLSDGLFGWITIAINTSATYDPNYSFVLTADGGVEESGGTTTVDGEGSGNGTGNFTDFPSGSMTGAVPTASLAERFFQVDWR